jgi:hypothetical protein
VLGVRGKSGRVDGVFDGFLIVMPLESLPGGLDEFLLGLRRQLRLLVRGPSSHGLSLSSALLQQYAA